MKANTRKRKKKPIILPRNVDMTYDMPVFIPPDYTYNTKDIFNKNLEEYFK